MYFACFQNLSIKVTPKFEKCGKCLGIFANTTSKCTCIREILPYVRGMKVVLGPCIHLKLYISSRGTPCMNTKVYPPSQNSPVLCWSDLSNLSGQNLLVRQVSGTGVPNMILWRLPHPRPLIWTASLHKTLRLQYMRVMSDIMIIM